MPRYAKRHSFRDKLVQSTMKVQRPQPDQKTGPRTEMRQMQGFDISIDNHQTGQPRAMTISTALKAYFPVLLPHIHLLRWHRICEWPEGEVKGAARKKFMQSFPPVRKEIALTILLNEQGITKRPAKNHQVDEGN